MPLLRTPSLVPGIISAMVVLILVSPVALAKPDGSGRASCNDGLDNDGDGLADHPEDPGCASNNDDNESDPAVCADGVDNDGDGATDYPDDPDCTGPWHPHESAVPHCSDGVDNDADEATDSEDLDCTITSGDSEAPCTDLRQLICWVDREYDAFWDRYGLNW